MKMRKTDIIVVNTGPLLAWIIALNDLSFLTRLYKRVIVPLEVCEEIMVGGKSGLGISDFMRADYLNKRKDNTKIASLLLNSLDKGEASVIQLAQDEDVKTVCIDEIVGRRVARLSGLKVTGSLGVLLRAKQEGLDINIKSIIQRFKESGVWISEDLGNWCMEQAGEL